MRQAFNIGSLAILLLACTAGPTLAQDVERGSEVKVADGRGGEGGLEILSGTRMGEAAFHVGYFQGNQLVAFRFGARDETDAIPCSVGVMYEYTFGRRRARPVTPIVGGSVSRIFSCATDADLVERPSPLSHGAVLLNGGVRVSIFSGNAVSGSLKFQGYLERLSGHEDAGDDTSTGVMVSLVIHGR